MKNIKALIITSLILLVGCKSVPKTTGDTSEDIAKQEITYLKYLLTPRAKAKEKDSPLWTKGGISNAVVQLRWISRMELKHRLEYWQSWLQDKSIPWGKNGSEDTEGFVYYDNNVAEYNHTIIWRTNTAESVEDVWRLWIEPSKGKEVYELTTAQFPKSKYVTEKPKDDAICVIMTYVENGELWVTHFYIASRVGIQSILYEVKHRGVDCEGWDHRDERFISPKWLSTELKYSDKLWQ